MSVKHIIKPKPGKGGGTLAYWVIAMKYAAYLSQQLEDDMIRSLFLLAVSSKDG